MRSETISNANIDASIEELMQSLSDSVIDVNFGSSRNTLEALTEFAFENNVSVDDIVIAACKSFLEAQDRYYGD